MRPAGRWAKTILCHRSQHRLGCEVFLHARVTFGLLLPLAQIGCAPVRLHVCLRFCVMSIRASRGFASSVFRVEPSVTCGSQLAACSIAAVQHCGLAVLCKNTRSAERLVEIDTSPGC